MGPAGKAGRREGKGRGERHRQEEVAAGGRMVMGRCTQAHFQLHSAHNLLHTQGLHTQLYTCHHQHTEPMAYTLDTHSWNGMTQLFSTPCHACTHSINHSPAAPVPLPAPAQPQLAQPSSDS